MCFSESFDTGSHGERPPSDGATTDDTHDECEVVVDEGERSPAERRVTEANELIGGEPSPGSGMDSGDKSPSSADQQEFVVLDEVGPCECGCTSPAGQTLALRVIADSHGRDLHGALAWRLGDGATHSHYEVSTATYPGQGINAVWGEMKAPKPYDIILLHLGGNDLCTKEGDIRHTDGEIISMFQNVVAYLMTFNTTSHIFVSGILPRLGQAAFNNRMVTLVDELQKLLSTAQHVTFIDHSTTFYDYTTCTPVVEYYAEDGIHLSREGTAQLALNISQAINRVRLLNLGEGQGRVSLSAEFYRQPEQVDEQQAADFAQNLPTEPQKEVPITRHLRHKNAGERPVWCRCCGAYVPKGREHALAHHLPWYTEPALACQQCEIAFERPALLQRHLDKTGHCMVSKEDWKWRILEFLQDSAVALGRRDDLLICYVKNMELHPNIAAGGKRCPAALGYLDYDGHPLFSDAEPSYRWSPTTPACFADLAHWRTMVNLLAAAAHRNWYQDKYRQQVRPAIQQSKTFIFEEDLQTQQR